MLLRKDLIEGVEEKYVPMLKEVSICDFTKCISQLSGLSMYAVPDKMIKEYLLTWAKNKYKFFQMLGNKTRFDTAIEFKNIREDVSNEVMELGKDFPGFAPWLEAFKETKSNKIENSYSVSYDARNWINNFIPNFNIVGSTMTHFFKRYLNAPEELVTAIGRIFENETIKGTHTISIDPVDMMLASENPYNWQSCYRLEADNDSSHADGCLAAVLDDSSLITYLWNKEGKFSLYGKYEFKSIRYKRMRQWISISPQMTAVHFNSVYPSKSNCPEELEKQLREKVENVIAAYLNIENLWTRAEGCGCQRGYMYGYGEFSDFSIWKIKTAQNEYWEPYNVPIACPCGCGDTLPGSDEADGDDNSRYYYNGEGFVLDNFEERGWCEYCEEYCSCANNMGEYNCRGCSCWDNAHPYCDLEDENHLCENPSYYYTTDGYMESCSGHCEGCPMWEAHHKEKEEINKEEDEMTIIENEQSNTTFISLNEGIQIKSLSANDIVKGPVSYVSTGDGLYVRFED